jgi:hypothetical protein
MAQEVFQALEDLRAMLDAEEDQEYSKSLRLVSTFVSSFLVLGELYERETSHSVLLLLCISRPAILFSALRNAVH